MRIKYLVVLTVVLAVAVSASWLHRETHDPLSSSHPLSGGDEWQPRVATDLQRPSLESPGGPTVESAQVQTKTAEPTLPPPRTAQSVVADWAVVVTDARTSRKAARALDYVSVLCRTLQASRSKSDRFRDQRWIAAARRCPPDLPDAMTILATSAPPTSPALAQVNEATANGDLARRDEIAESLLRSSNDPDELEFATSTYFDGDRLLALAGDDRPTHIDTPGRTIELQIDLALLVSCTFQDGCPPDAPMTLAQCATTSLCYPGQTMGQIIAMRRSPEEMAYLERLLDHVHRIRKPGG